MAYRIGATNGSTAGRTIVSAAISRSFAAPGASLNTIAWPPRAATSCRWDAFFRTMALTAHSVNHRHRWIDQGDWTVLHLAGSIVLGVDVADLLQLQLAFHDDREAIAATEIPQVTRLHDGFCRKAVPPALSGYDPGRSSIGALHGGRFQRRKSF